MTNYSAAHMLSLLVLDLGYESCPAYGHNPVRHHVAWVLCENQLGRERVAELVDEMLSDDSSKCENCGMALSLGCEGTFTSDGNSCLLNRKSI